MRAERASWLSASRPRNPAAPSTHTRTRNQPTTQVYLITELVTGGELLEAVLQRGTYSESEARLAFVQLLKGIRYLHSM